MGERRRRGVDRLCAGDRREGAGVVWPAGRRSALRRPLHRQLHRRGTGRGETADAQENRHRARSQRRSRHRGGLGIFQRRGQQDIHAGELEPDSQRCRARDLFDDERRARLALFESLPGPCLLPGRACPARRQLHADVRPRREQHRPHDLLLAARRHEQCCPVDLQRHERDAHLRDVVAHRAGRLHGCRGRHLQAPDRQDRGRRARQLLFALRQCLDHVRHRPPHRSREVLPVFRRGAGAAAGRRPRRRRQHPHGRGGLRATLRREQFARRQSLQRGRAPARQRLCRGKGHWCPPWRRGRELPHRNADLREAGRPAFKRRHLVGGRGRFRDGA